MKRTLLIFSFISVLAISMPVLAKKQRPIYIMGVSTSFADSVVYLTEIQKLDSVTLGAKGKMLPHRQHYAYELKDYMALQESVPGRTSAIFFSKKLSSLQKKEQKIKKRFLRKNNMTIKYLGSKFKFTPANYGKK